MEKKATRAERLAAFEAIVSEYEAPLLRYAARIVGNEVTAQDVVQQAFIRLYRNWRDEWEPSPRISSWLYRVTHNCAVDMLRRESRRRLLHKKQAEERPNATPPDRGREARISDEAVEAVQALRKLDLREQQLVVLKVFEEKTYKEISEITGLTTSNVGYILHHAMKKLAKIMAVNASAEEGSQSEQTG